MLFVRLFFVNGQVIIVTVNMKEKLIINNFAGIKHLELCLNEINILIGPQASGKSITAKLLYYFKSFFMLIRMEIENGKSQTEIDSEQVNKFISYFPKETWSKDSFLIEYILGTTKMKIYSNEKTMKFEYSENIRNIIRDAKTILNRDKEIMTKKGFVNLEIIQNYANKFNQLINKEIATFSSYEQLFVPAGRSFFSNIQTNVFSFLNSNKSLDPFLVEFGSFYENLKSVVYDYSKETENKKKHKEFQKLINEILNAQYLRHKNKDFLLHADNRKVNMSNASSGQQEILPLLSILRVLLIADFMGGGAVLYIEEPEAHLFPNAQKKVVQLLARLFNSEKYKFQIIITTHSPYILSSFNNIMYAGSLKDKFKGGKNEEISNIISEQEIISPDLISAYSLDIGGKKTNLIDEETQLISQNMLDSVSNEISIEFGKLLDIEYED